MERISSSCIYPASRITYGGRAGVLRGGVGWGRAFCFTWPLFRGFRSSLTAITGVMSTIRTTESNAHHLHFCRCGASQTSVSPQCSVNTTTPAAISGRFTMINSNSPSLLKFIPRTPSSMILKRTFRLAAGASASRLPAWIRPLPPSGGLRARRAPGSSRRGMGKLVSFRLWLMEPALLLLLLLGPLLVMRLLMRGVEESTRCCSSFVHGRQQHSNTRKFSEGARGSTIAAKDGSLLIGRMYKDR